MREKQPIHVKAEAAQGYLPEDTAIEDIPLVEALNFRIRLPVRESISETIPSAPAL